MKKSLRLKDRHGWKARPGYAICVIDRGAIRFDYPAGWHVTSDSDSLKVRDSPPPDDNCILAVSRLRLPSELADQVALRTLLPAAIHNDAERETPEHAKFVDVPRKDGIEIAYSEIRRMEPAENREAFSRIGIARGAGVYALITFDFWADDRAKCDPVWQEALRSLILGMYVQDPTVGPIVQ